MSETPWSDSRFDRRRRALMERHPDGPILVRGGSTSGTSSNFLYLTGIDEPKAVLLLAAGGVRIGTGRKHPGPDYIRGRMAEQVLFLPAADSLMARWGEAGSATLGNVAAEEARVDAVLGLDELEAVLQGALSGACRVHFVRGHPASLSGREDPDSAFVSRVRNRFIGLQAVDATPTVHASRRLKDAGEVAAIERAVAVTAEALEEVVARVAPGLREYELEAEITRVYRSHGGRHAFDPIVACGRNACQLHYDRNSGSLQPDTLLLVDTGTSLDGYKSDVTRSYPVSGRFLPRQREIYETVLSALERATALCRPGVLLGDVHEMAYRVIDEAGYGSFFVHGTSHFLGLETHDVGDVHRALEDGCVVTVEPGIYLPDEGIGVRIEDDVLVTADGPRVLSAAIPKSIEAIERGMERAR